MKSQKKYSKLIVKGSKNEPIALKFLKRSYNKKKDSKNLQVLG